MCLKTIHYVLLIIAVLVILSNYNAEGFRCPCGRPYPYKCPYGCSCPCHITGVC